MKEALRADLQSAMKARDRDAVAALRSLLAAIDNAEAVDVDVAANSNVSSEHVAGGVAGLGAAERPRRELSEAELIAIVAEERRQHLDAAARAESAGLPDIARTHAAQAGALDAYLNT
jgi:uncharacterized protein YqeY